MGGKLFSVKLFLSLLTSSKYVLIRLINLSLFSFNFLSKIAMRLESPIEV